MRFPLLTRGALVAALPTSTALDRVVFTESTLPRLAGAAREWLLAQDLSPELRSEILAASGDEDLALVALATVYSRAFGQEWPWRNALA